MNKALLKGLYCITDPELSRQSPLNIIQMVEQAIAGGARIIQYRDKQAPSTEQLEVAQLLCALCRQNNVLFLINDNPQLAKTVDAHGVHLGQTDSKLKEARDLLGENKIIGITCHADLQLALAAEQQGADYVAFGRFFPSRTKPEASPAAPECLPGAKQQLRIPIAAIGGITPANAHLIVDAGADMLAVIHAVFGQSDIRRAAQQLSDLFD